MIPYAILSGDVYFTDNTHIEIRVLNLSADTLSFRLAKRYADKTIESIRLQFYSFQEAGYKSITLESPEFSCKLLSYADSYKSVKSRDLFFDVYEIAIKSPISEEYVKNLTKEYLSYIRLKNDGDDGALSKALTGYPAEEDEKFTASIEDFRKKCFDEVSSCLPGNADGKTDFTYALDLNTPGLIKKFLSLSWAAFLEDMSQTYYAGKIKLAGDADGVPGDGPAGEDADGLKDGSVGDAADGLKDRSVGDAADRLKISEIYLGNQFSFDYFPDKELLMKATEKARKLDITPIIALPPLSENQLWQVIELLDAISMEPSGLAELIEATELAEAAEFTKITEHTGLTELIVNDWGLLEHLSNTDKAPFHLTLGILLNKRKKDSRLAYKNGKEKQVEVLRMNSTNAEFLQETLLTRYGISRFSYESCEYPYELAGEGHVLHLPYYQMNTGGSKKNWSQEYLFYPEHIHMIGTAHTLFGFDQRILTDKDYLQSFLNQKPSRIVLELI